MRAAFWKVAGVLVVVLLGVEVFLSNTAVAEDTQPSQRAVEPGPSTTGTAAVRKPATPQQEIGVSPQHRERRKPQGNGASKISNATLSVSGGGARTATSSGKPKTNPSAGSLGPISRMPHPKSVSTRPIAGANGKTTATSQRTAAQRGEGAAATSMPRGSADSTGTLSDPSLVSQSWSTPSSVSQFQGYSANFVAGQITTGGQVGQSTALMGVGWINSVTANPQMQTAAARGLLVSPLSSSTATQPTQSAPSATPGANSNTEPSGVPPVSEAATRFGPLTYPSDMPASLISSNSTPPEAERSDQVSNSTGLRNTLLSRDSHDPSVSDNSEGGSLPAGSNLKRGDLKSMAVDVVRGGEDAQSGPESGPGSTSATQLSPSVVVTAASAPPQNVAARSSAIQAGRYLPTASSSDVTGMRSYTSPPSIGPTASTSLGSVTTSPILFCLPFFPLLLLVYFGLRLS